MSIDWEQGEFTALLNKKDGIRRGPFGSALKKEFFVAKSDYVVYEQQNAIYRNFKARYNITKEKFDELNKFQLKPDDFIMSGAGTIGKIARVPKKIKPGIFNQALIRFRINSEKADSEYFIQFVRANFMQKKLTGTNPGSAITNLVPMSEVKKWKILFPNITEQHRLGKFLKNIDKAITLQQRKLELLKKLKRGYLQQVLPAKNEFIPNIRFVNYFNDWKYITLSDLFKYEQPAEYIVKSTAYDVNFKIPVLTAGKSFILGYTDEKFGIKLASSDAPAIIFDDFTVSSHFVDFPFKVKSSALKILSLQNNQNNFYFAYNILKRINYKPQNHSRHWISKFSQFSVAIPTPDEQQNIGNFIKIIDNTLLLQEDKIKKIIDLKKGYLQKLFL
ncbi:restriction endonuclease subunit S [Latilactobacillus graminis]|uniref:Restriction-modification enzyme type I S subunit n=1 Tax=Latilactobacillus graminis DSM 20719 TaxID=1423752 RepID=A0AA89I7J9_9LACO|nr:restriction endonuclease subunit S [Latilactobacillus graminis]KRM22457.1 restriction-modification enzyme type I S subunit [Latilactobacillus graminis DSM 20719]